jgi:hypothetical protein
MPTQRIILKPLAPPVEKLRATLRIDMPYRFSQENFPDEASAGYFIGRPVVNILDAVNEESAMMAAGMTAATEMLDNALMRDEEDNAGDCVSMEWVLVDDENTIWSQTVMVPEVGDRAHSRDTVSPIVGTVDWVSDDGARVGVRPDGTEAATVGPASAFTYEAVPIDGE